MSDATLLALGIIAAVLTVVAAYRDSKCTRKERLSNLDYDRELIRQKFAPAAANDRRAQAKYAQLKMHNGSYSFGAVPLRFSDPERRDNGFSLYNY